MVEELVYILDVCENDENGMGTTNSNFADDEVNPCISDPKLANSTFSENPLSKISHFLRYPTLSDFPLSQISHSLIYPTLSDIPLS